MKPVILRTDAELFILEPRMQAVLEIADVITAPSDDEETLVRLAGEADIILTCYAFITRAVIEAAPKLKGIVKYGVGTDAIDIETATERGVAVVNCPDYGTDTVADHAFALLMALGRRVPELNRDIQVKAWYWPKHENKGTDISFKTLGLLGCGLIGKALARRGLGFSMEVISYDPYVDDTIMEEMGVKPVSFEELLSRSDYFSVHCVRTPETHGILGEAEFRAMEMKPYFINVSRGAIAQEDALIKALDEGWIAGAGIDVFAKEPLQKDYPLLGRDNVILTPHLAWWTVEAFERCEDKTLRRIREFVGGQRPKHLKNPQVFG
jgi:D-3-phosphoglycerate dehydrogenase / 2-oxoglutarate reductase